MRKVCFIAAALMLSVAGTVPALGDEDVRKQMESALTRVIELARFLETVSKDCERALGAGASAEAPPCRDYFKFAGGPEMKILKMHINSEAFQDFLVSESVIESGRTPLLLDSIDRAHVSATNISNYIALRAR